jgi:hypothetical protein
MIISGKIVVELTSIYADTIIKGLLTGGGGVCSPVRQPVTIITKEKLCHNEMQSHSTFISLQWGFTHQTNSTAAGPDSKQVLHRWICMLYAKTAQGSQMRDELQMRFSAVDLSRKWWNWFNLNIVLLLSTWQNQHLFLTTHFNQICQKMLRSAYKNNERNYFTEFFKYRNHKRSESLCGIFPIH